MCLIPPDDTWSYQDRKPFYIYLIHAWLGQPLETTRLIRTAGKLTFHIL
ncbi:MAG: hypothetical protein AB7G68_03080 [Nitrospiraceae bacterium]